MASATDIVMRAQAIGFQRNQVQLTTRKPQARIRKSSGKVQESSSKDQEKFRESSVDHQETSSKVQEKFQESSNKVKEKFS